MPGGADLMDFDLATVEKLPVIERLLRADGERLTEPCLDIGIGTGTTTSRAFAGHRTIAVDAWRPNLEQYRASLDETARSAVWNLQASGERLPLESGSVGTVLCSEVLEHVEDDGALMREIARVLRPGGVAVVTVPSMYYGFDSYLHLIGMKTVHDFPGPERHVRPGYTEEGLRALAEKHGLQIERVEYLFRPLSKLAMEAVSFAHIVYERLVHGRRSWSWSDVSSPAVSGGLAFRLYQTAFPLLRGFGRLDRMVPWRGGFGLAARLRRR